MPAPVAVVVTVARRVAPAAVVPSVSRLTTAEARQDAEETDDQPEREHYPGPVGHE
jgi:hypothetical protein